MTHLQVRSRRRRQSLKLVLVGDRNVGKTCLLLTYIGDSFPMKDCQPTVFESFNIQLNIANEEISVAMFDLPGQEIFDTLRPLSYQGTDVFVVCFSVECHESFQNVSQKWLPEIRHHCPDAPFLLVGTKTDLRPSEEDDEAVDRRNIRRNSDDSLIYTVTKHRSRFRRELNCCKNSNFCDSARFVREETGRTLARALKAIDYVETSTHLRENVDVVFGKAIMSAIDFPKKFRDKMKCSIM